MPILNKREHTNSFIINRMMAMVMLVLILIVLLYVNPQEESVVARIGTIVAFKINVKFTGMATTVYKKSPSLDVQVNDQ